MNTRLVFLSALALVLAACRSKSDTASPSPTPSQHAAASATSSPASSTSTASPSQRELDSTTPALTPGGVRCGVERWPVKTLSDGDAGRVDFSPIPATVAQLRSLPAPGSLPQSSRIAPTELTVYSVTANVVKFKLEGDRDFHVVISDLNDPSQTMIVELADAAQCSGAVASAHASEMRDARQAFIAAYGSPSTSFRNVSGTATFTGVGFFDFQHGQTGVAPNAIELHPVLSFTTGSGAPPPPATNAQPPPPPPPAPPVTQGYEYACEATDRNCADFPAHAEAQRIFLKHGGSPTNNWSGLDRDHDGIGCESLP